MRRNMKIKWGGGTGYSSCIGRVTCSRPARLIKRQGKKMIPVLLCVIFAVSAFMTVTASAATAGQDGVEAELTFSKTEYRTGEDLDATLTVRNLNQYPVHNVQTKIVLPEGMKLASGSLPSKAFTLAANETKTYEATLAKETVPDTPKKSSDPGAGSTSSKTAKTGDDSNTGIFIALMLLSGGVLVFVMVRRKRLRGKGVIPFILCFIVLGAVMLPMTADAAGKQKEFTVGDTVKVDGKEVTVKAVISYDHVVHSGVTVNNGTVVNPTGTNLYKEGETVTITADEAPEGQHFSGWTVVSGGAVLADNTKETTTFEMPANDVEITADYEANVYTIEATAGEGGKISPKGNVDVTHGEPITFTITPDIGYHIKDVEVDKAGQGAIAEYTFDKVTKAHTIKAIFAKDTFKITTIAGENGSITPASPTVDYGANVSFAITPELGYLIEDVQVDNESVGNVDLYEFKNVTAVHTISATFEFIDSDELKNAVREALDNGQTDIVIAGNLNADQQNAAGEALREWCRADYFVRQGTISLTLSDVIQVSDNAFKGEMLKSALKSLNLPQATTIGAEAFFEQRYLESVTAPKVEQVSKGGFYSCERLVTAQMPSVTSVGETAFSGCPLSDFNWDKLITIGRDAFFGGAFKNVVLPETATLGGGAFRYCSKLESVTAQKVTDVPYWTFADCPKLTSLTFGSAMASWGGQVLEKDNTSSITLTLASDQKVLSGDNVDTDSIWKIDAGASLVDVGLGKTFCGYTFKEIKH